MGMEFQNEGNPPRVLWEATEKERREREKQERLLTELHTAGLAPEELDPHCVYRCWECGFQWLTVDTLAWRFGVLAVGNSGGWVYCYRVTCRDQRDCWRRAEFMGTASWRKSGGQNEQES